MDMYGPEDEEEVDSDASSEEAAIAELDKKIKAKE
jgi:hypothetical protein